MVKKVTAIPSRRPRGGSKASGPKKRGPGRESEEALRARALEIVRRLYRAYPDARCALQHRSALELLVATILSAQCTDARVNLVTRELFQKYRGAEDYAKAPLPELEEAIRSTGFFRAKAKSIKSCCQEICERHGGQVPSTLEELTRLRGVGRKTANVILGNAFGVPGIVVDTHVKRLAGRLGLTRNQDPVKIEFDLMPVIPRKDWTYFSHALIFHGRRICKARKPDCPKCPLAEVCPSRV
ncbi:MAG: endonuclease III [Planctomycetes bacterium]|nr:endonuclease III [Planctomycetota bacterium]